MTNKGGAVSIPDWAYFAGFAANVAALLGGFSLLPTHRDLAIAMIASFGPGSFAFGVAAGRRRPPARRLSAALQVETAGRAPDASARLYPILTGACCLGLGVVAATFGPPLGAAFGLAGLGVAIAAGFALAALALRPLPNGNPLFGPSGVTVGSRGCSYVVSWDNIARIGPGEVGSNPCLLIRLRRHDVVIVEPPESTRPVYRRFAENEASSGAHIILDTDQCRMEVDLLAQTLDRYAALSQRLSQDNAPR